MIARLDLAAIDDLRDALPQFPHPPLAHLHHLNLDQRRAFWLGEISNCLANESSLGFASIASGCVNGFLVYNDSPWDSKITSRRIGTVKHLAATADGLAGTQVLHELIDECMRKLARRGTQCVSYRVQAAELAAIQTLEECDFLLMDTLLDFVFDLSRSPIEQASPKRDERLKIRRADQADMPELMALNERAFANYFGRYHADPRIPPGTATKVYAEWMRSAFAGWADWIVVAEFEGKIAGHGVWRKTSQDENSRGIAYCDLLVVDPEFQGRRLGTALMLDGMHIARDFARYVVGPVHVCNYAVQHTLQNLGWRICGARHAFHKWLKP
jgi:predicted N-acetyltransferase YhbS